MTIFCEQIILQGTEDDESSVGIDVQDQSDDGEPQRESFIEDHVDGNEIPSLDPEYSDGIAQDYNRQKKELAGRTMPFVNSVSSNVPNEDEDLLVSQDEPIEYSGSRGQNPRSYGGNFSSSREERYQIVYIYPKRGILPSICMFLFSSLRCFIVLSFSCH